MLIPHQLLLLLEILHYLAERLLENLDLALEHLDLLLLGLASLIVLVNRTELQHVLPLCLLVFLQQSLLLLFVIVQRVPLSNSLLS